MSDEKKVRPSSALAGKIAGFDICRRAIYQTVVGREAWANDMLKAIAACRMLGVQTFEIDVRYDENAVRPGGQKKQDNSAAYGISMFSIFRDNVEGEEWRTAQQEATEEAAKVRKGADVLTIYAVVVE